VRFRHLRKTDPQRGSHPNVGFKIIEQVSSLALAHLRLTNHVSIAINRGRTVFFVPLRANCDESFDAICRSTDLVNDRSSISAIVYLREEVIVDLHAAIGEQLREMSGRADEEVVAHDLRYRPLILVAIFYLIPIGILEQREQR